MANFKDMDDFDLVVHAIKNNADRRRVIGWLKVWGVIEKMFPLLVFLSLVATGVYLFIKG